jgi:hypothetical protein
MIVVTQHDKSSSLLFVKNTIIALIYLYSSVSELLYFLICNKSERIIKIRKMGIVFGKTGVAEPAFDVLLSRAEAQFSYQIRQYGTRYAIETEYDPIRGTGAGFSALAGYIGVTTKPQNEGSVSISMTAPVITEDMQQQQVKGQKIAMTSPVITSDEGRASAGGMKKMQFVLPAEYDQMSKIPKPTNPKVAIKEIPSAVGAVHAFTGQVNDEKAKKNALALIQQLKEDGVDIDEKVALESYELWQYHPPFTLGPFRRNEIWMELTRQQLKKLLDKHKESKGLTDVN